MECTKKGCAGTCPLFVGRALYKAGKPPPLCWVCEKPYKYEPTPHEARPQSVRNQTESRDKQRIAELQRQLEKAKRTNATVQAEPTDTVHASTLEELEAGPDL